MHILFLPVPTDGSDSSSWTSPALPFLSSPLPSFPFPCPVFLAFLSSLYVWPFCDGGAVNMPFLFKRTEQGHTSDNATSWQSGDSNLCEKRHWRVDHLPPLAFTGPGTMAQDWAALCRVFFFFCSFSVFFFSVPSPSQAHNKINNDGIHFQFSFFFFYFFFHFRDTSAWAFLCAAAATVECATPVITFQ